MTNQKRLRIFLIGLAIGAGLGLIATLGGCMTVKGFAQDLAATADGLQQAGGQ